MYKKMDSPQVSPIVKPRAEHFSKERNVTQSHKREHLSSFMTAGKSVIYTPCCILYGFNLANEAINSLG